MTLIANQKSAENADSASRTVSLLLYFTRVTLRVKIVDVFRQRYAEGKMAIRRLRFAMVIAVLVSPIICGLGLCNEAEPAYVSSQQMISSLRSCLNHARLVLETQVDLSQNYKEQVYLLASMMEDIENKLRGIETCSSLSPSRSDSFPVQSSEAIDGQTRITLMGARALTEFKAEQLSHELQKLTKVSQNRQSDFNDAIEKAAALSEEIVRLKNILQQTTLRRDIQLAENNVKLNSGPKKHAWQGEICQFKRNISEEDNSPVTLRQASAEAAQVKTTEKLVMQETTPLNAEAAVTVDELRRKMEQATKQAKALQELVSKIAAQTELLKTQGQQTESKLNDMRKVTKMWQEKKIPVNSEAVALENKLSSDMVIYQNTLKEIDRLNHFLTSMFNEVLRTGPTR